MPVRPEAASARVLRAPAAFAAALVRCLDFTLQDLETIGFAPGIAMDPDGADASEPDAPCLKRHGEDRAIHAAAAPCPSGSRLLAPERLAVGAKEGRKRRDDQTTAPRPPRGRVVPSSARTCSGRGSAIRVRHPGRACARPGGEGGVGLGVKI